MNKFLSSLIVITLLAGGCSNDNRVQTNNLQKTNSPEERNFKDLDFSHFNSNYQFSSQIPQNWQIEYIPATKSLNIYNPENQANNNLEKSEIYISYFTSNQFLTLNTVNILSKQETLLKGHKAIKYEIIKKDEVPNFVNQPLWRSQKHKLIDVRYSESNPSNFFVIAYNPQLSQSIFDKFTESLNFYNDKSSLREPLQDSQKRITKKHFGTQVSPNNSPVSPEKFSGYHTGTDFEILNDDELNHDVKINTICGGPLISKNTVSGYGGLIMQQCEIGNQRFTVSYGHMKLDSVKYKVNEYLMPGTSLGVLGKANSSENGDERKHLHLGLYIGTRTNVAGYVKIKNELDNWFDYEKLIQK